MMVVRVVRVRVMVVRVMVRVMVVRVRVRVVMVVFGWGEDRVVDVKCGRTVGGGERQDSGWRRAAGQWAEESSRTVGRGEWQDSGRRRVAGQWAE